MWRINRLKATNFMSFQQVDLALAPTCHVVRAENRQNAGQSSNGGGKTSLCDLFAVALLGKSLTGRNVKDCCRWGSQESFFTVTLELVNGEQTCSIHRKIYSNTRSQELTLLLNGEVPSGLPSKKGVEHGVDLKAGNQYILQEVLDLTEDDLLSHYLISATHYRPFLHLSTPDKLAVIGRFAKTQPVNRVLTQLEIDKVACEHDLWEDQQKIAEGEGYLQALTDEASEAARQQFETDKSQRVEELQQELADSVRDLEVKQGELEQAQARLCVTLEEAEGNVVVTEIPGNLTELKRIQVDLATTHTQVLDQIETAKTYLAGLVTCPNCQAEFHPLREHRGGAEMTYLTIEELEVHAAQLDAQQDDVRLLINELHAEVSAAQARARERDQAVSFAKQREQQLTKQATSLLKEHERITTALTKAEAVTFEAELSASAARAQVKRDELVELRARLVKDQADLDSVKLWAERFMDFKFYVGNQPLARVCELVNSYLALAASDLNLHIEGVKKLRSGELRQALEPTVYRNWSNPQPLHQLSTGEQARLHLAVDLPFQDLLNQASKTGGLDLLVNDELLGEVDSAGVGSVARAFAGLDRTILLVTHSGADLVYDHTILVRKENNVSTVA